MHVTTATNAMSAKTGATSPSRRVRVVPVNATVAAIEAISTVHPGPVLMN